MKERRVLPSEAPAISAEHLRGLYRLLDDTGLLEDGEPGYTEAKQLRGVVVEALGRDGCPLLFIGVQGGEVANDHHPYYEFAFAIDSPDGHPRLLSAQRFYYDVAGIEGWEWPVFLPVLAFLALIPTVAVQEFLLSRGRGGGRLDETGGATSAVERDPLGPERIPSGASDG